MKVTGHGGDPATDSGGAYDCLAGMGMGTHRGSFTGLLEEEQARLAD